MAMRKRICGHCAGQFEYAIARGVDRRYCSKACRDRARLVQREQRRVGKRCSVPDCPTPPRDGGSAYCELHYGRLRRNGSLDVPRRAKDALDHTHGYVLVYAPGHPMATPGHNHVYEHRKVFYDAHGEGPFTCHVCGTPLTWADMHVDHLDDNRRNNAAENLAAACPKCNTWRGKHKINRNAVAQRGIEFQGERLTIRQWAMRVGIAPGNLARRLKSGWPLERALTEGRGRTGPKPTRMLA